MERVAVIDLGTNTFNILIAESDNKRIQKTIYQTKLPVKLGEGGLNSGLILEIPYKRGLDAMLHFSQLTEKHHCNRVLAFATSAIRTARNGADFVADVKKQTGITVQVIDGSREAELIYEGVRLSGILGEKTSLILDIGGGSCEFILCNQHKILWKQSFEIGVSRLFDTYKPADPLSERAIQEITQLFEERLSPMYEAIKTYPCNELIGSSGSFDTFAEMICLRKLNDDSAAKELTYTFNLHDFEENHQLLVKSTIAERNQMRGLIALRIDMIVIASLMVHFLIHKLSIKQLKVSSYSLKEGVIASYL